MGKTVLTELDETERRIEAQLGEAVLLVERVGDAVLHPGSSVARGLCADGARLKRACRRIEVDLVTVTARSAPAAGDLRRVVALLQIAHHAALIANQFGLIGEQVVKIDPRVDDGRGTSGRVSGMAFMAAIQLEAAAAAFAQWDATRAAELERDDDQLDRLNREVFAAAHQLEVSPVRRELALRHVLIARSLERIGDNSVKIAGHAATLAEATRALAQPSA
jgi:phosphate transport system protein